MKKSIRTISCIIAASLVMVGVASCNGIKPTQNQPSLSETPKTQVHEHTYSSNLDYDRKGHYYPATCEHTDMKKDYEEHQYLSWETVKEATEKEEGSKERKCSVCGYVETESIPCKQHTHTYGGWNVKLEPTLTSEGSLERTCQGDSSHIDTFTLPRLNKTNYTYEVETSPTCNENGAGKAKYTYKKDDQNFSFSVALDKLSHTYGAWKLETNPTLESKGNLKRVCDKNSSHIDKYELPILNSTDYSYSVVKNPTCFEDGLDRYTIVKDGINFSFDVERPSQGHSYKDTYSFDSTKHWLDPTCEHQEKIKDIQSHTLENGVCKVCSYSQDTEVSEGVIYTLNEEQTEYIASIDTNYQGESIVILSQYNGLPVTSINSEGFKDSTAKFITIPGSIKTIDTDAFKGCENFVAIFYSGTITDWCNIEFKNEYATPMYYATSFYMLNDTAWEEVTEINVPESVTVINNYQFYGFTKLTHIKLSDSLMRTGEYAFANCSGLEEINITSHYIDANALKGCSSLSRLTLAYLDPVVILGYYFGGNNSSVPESLTELTILDGAQIKNSAFANLKNLTKLSLPNTLKKVGTGIVSGCDKLVYNEKDNGLYLGNEKNKYLVLMSIKDKEVEEFSIDDNTKIIASQAFYQASNLKEIVIPNGVVEIGSSAFRYATSLKSISIPSNVTELYDYTFANCTALEEIVIPATVLTISNSCFSSTTIVKATLPYHGLSAITDTSKLEELYLLNGEGAINLASYSKLKKVNLPLGITSIGDKVIEKCPDLVYNEDEYSKYLGNEEEPYIWLMQVKDKVISECQIQDTTRYIYDQAFIDCTQLERIQIPSNIVSIGKEAFKNNTKLWLVSFPSISQKLEIIGNNAFEGCAALESITLPDSLTTIGSSIFKNCTSIKKLSLPFVGKTKNPSEASSNTLFGYLFGQGTGTSVSQSYVNTPTSSRMIDYNIPDSLKEVVVRGGKLMNGVFMNCTMITDITIYNDVECVVGYSMLSPKIPSNFDNCEFLHVTIPDKFISLMNYDSRTGLASTIQSLTITSGETIDHLDMMSALTELYLADGIKTIVWSGIQDCPKLQTVKLPSQLETIEGMAFHNCPSLKNIIIPSSVKNIGNSAFYGCEGLEYVYLPKNIETFGTTIFNECNAKFYLEASEIPAGWDLASTRPIWYNIKQIVEVDDVVYAIQDSNALFVGYAKEDSTGIEIPSSIVYEDITYPVIS